MILTITPGGAITNATHRHDGSLTNDEHLEMPFDYVELIRPSHDELETVRQRFLIDRDLLEHVQDRRVAPGIGEANDGQQLHIRFNVPSMPLDSSITWDRVDVLFGERFVLVVQQRESTPVSRAVARFRDRADRTPADFVSLILAQVVDVFHLVLLSIERDIDANATNRDRSNARKDGVEPSQIRGIVGDLGRAAERLSRLLEQAISDEYELIGKPARRQLQVSRDRVGTVNDDVERIRERTEPSAPTLPERENALGAESPEVIETAAEVGERRLRRLNPAHAVTALMGAFGVSFGAIAMAWTAGPWVESLGFERAQLIGALAFPVGFVIVLVGKGELFTENFFFPISGVIRGRGTIRELFELWGYVLFFNMIGSVIAAFLMSRTGVLDGHAEQFLNHVAVDKVNYPFWTAFMKAIFAGWLMTIMTWLILAATGLGPRLVVIWMTGFLIVAAHFNHVVISAPEIFTAMFAGAPISIGDWFLGNFVPALLGNLIGGVVFVTILGFAQARTLEQGEQENQGGNRDSRSTRYWTR